MDSSCKYSSDTLSKCAGCVQEVTRGQCATTVADATVCCSCVQPGLMYFQECLSECLLVLLAVFKAAQLLSPPKIQEMKPECTAVDALSAFPFLHPVTLGISSKNCLSMSLQQKTSPQHRAHLSFGKDVVHIASMGCSSLKSISRTALICCL